jgi:hypothetical protein
MTSPVVKFHGAWATGPYRITSRDPPWVAGLDGVQNRGWWPSQRVHRRCGRGDVGAAAVLVPLPSAEVRELACEGVRGEARA